MLSSNPPTKLARPAAPNPQVQNFAESELPAQVTRLTTKLETLQVQVRQAQQLSVLGTAAATLAHEVNNLLTPLLAYADTALTSDDPNLSRKALTVAAKNARILVAMSERLLEIGAAKPPRREVVNVRQVIDAALASLCRDLAKDGIKVLIDCPPERTAYCDALQLQQILFNLFLNAREAMGHDHGGVLKISATSESPTDASPCLVLEIRNTGPAIPPELLPHLFEPFQSSKSSTRSGKARCGGLGLALCRDLVHENGGTIEVVSNSSGTTFRLTLPTNP